MKKISILIVLGIIFFGGSKLFSMLCVKEPERNREVALDAYFKNQTEQQNFSGTVLIVQNGTILLKKAYGFANYELDVSNTLATKFRIGSLTKQFTALAIMQLQEKGELKVSDKLARYIPDFPNAANITLHQLLTHTSGIFNISTMPDILERAKQSITLEKEVDIIKHGKPEFSPGHHYSYNNSGYIVLTSIIEKVSGKSYENYMQDHIFKPLGMTSSGVDSPIALIKNRAAGYNKDQRGLINAPYSDMAWNAGAGELYSTIDDMCRWHRALRNATILSQEYINTLMAPHVQMETDNEWYGYAFWHVKKTPFGPLIGHRGSAVGFRGVYYYYPDHDVTLILLSNFMFAPFKESIIDALMNIIIRGQETH